MARRTHFSQRAATGSVCWPTWPFTWHGSQVNTVSLQPVRGRASCTGLCKSWHDASTSQGRCRARDQPSAPTQALLLPPRRDECCAWSSFPPAPTALPSPFCVPPGRMCTVLGALCPPPRTPKLCLGPLCVLPLHSELSNDSHPAAQGSCHKFPFQQKPGQRGFQPVWEGPSRGRRGTERKEM